MSLATNADPIRHATTIVSTAKMHYFDATHPINRIRDRVEIWMNVVVSTESPNHVLVPPSWTILQRVIRWVVNHARSTFTYLTRMYIPENLTTLKLVIRWRIRLIHPHDGLRWAVKSAKELLDLTSILVFLTFPNMIPWINILQRIVYTRHIDPPYARGQCLPGNGGIYPDNMDTPNTAHHRTHHVLQYLLGGSNIVVALYLDRKSVV